jgi:hypothetical protein
MDASFSLSLLSLSLEPSRSFIFHFSLLLPGARKTGIVIIDDDDAYSLSPYEQQQQLHP